MTKQTSLAVLCVLLQSACSKDGVGAATDAETLPAGQSDAGEGVQDASARGDARITTPRDRDAMRPATDAAACNHAELQLDPRSPNTYLLVDRSGSMFLNKLWEPLKEGVLQVVQQLSKEVRFGFASYTGKNGGTCPDMTYVEIADDNYSAIATAYQALGEAPYKAETPTALGIAAITERLSKLQDDGPKSIVLVTDGEPDFCDDGNVTCARDAVVAAVQAAHAKDITTFVVSIDGQVDQAHLRQIANAGTGGGVVDANGAVVKQCGSAKASYGTTSGTAPYFEPDVDNRAALVETLSNVVARTRSCVFDLSGQLKIDLDRASDGKLTIDGASIPYGGSDGFRMNTPTELELLGAACESVRKPASTKIMADFPCEALILL